MLLSDYINKKVEMAKMNIKLHERKYVWMDYAKDKLNIIGLMCIPPVDEDSKKHFEILRELAKQLNLSELSMGMSHDYLQAGLAGATYVRVGSKIFGLRS